jgi:glutathione S-transferase
MSRSAKNTRPRLARNNIAAGVRILEARLADTDYAVGEEDVIAVLNAVGVQVVDSKISQSRARSAQSGA